MKRREGLSLAFIASDIQQLLACCVLWREAILNVGLEERVVWNSAFEPFLEMVFVEKGQGFRRNPILASIAPPRDRCLEANLVRSSKTLHCGERAACVPRLRGRNSRNGFHERSTAVSGERSEEPSAPI